MRRILAVLAALIALTLAPSATPYATHPGLDAVASWLAQSEVQVRCFNARESAKDELIGFWGASGYVLIDGSVPPFGRPYPYAVLAWPICKTLLDMEWNINQWRWRWDEMVWAVMVIVHESGHMRGDSWPFWKSERQVNIWTLKRAFAVATLKFNVPADQKRAFNEMAIAIYLGQPHAYNGGRCPSPFLDEFDNVRCAH